MSIWDPTWAWRAHFHSHQDWLLGLTFIFSEKFHFCCYFHFFSIESTSMYLLTVVTSWLLLITLGESVIEWKELKIRTQEIWDLVSVPKLTSWVVMSMWPISAEEIEEEEDWGLHPSRTMVVRNQEELPSEGSGTRLPGHSQLEDSATAHKALPKPRGHIGVGCPVGLPRIHSELRIHKLDH